MPAQVLGQAPSLDSFLRSLKGSKIESSIELLISLLKRRQIKNSRPCAIATARLLLQVVAEKRWQDPQQLIKRIRLVGHRLVLAQPREITVGNIVRRVLGVVREIAEDDEDESTGLASPPPEANPTHRPNLPTTISAFSPLHQTASSSQGGQAQSRSDISSPVSNDSPPRRPAISTVTSYAGQGSSVSLFGIFQHPSGVSPMATPPMSGSTTPRGPKRDSDQVKEKLDIKAEVINGIQELLDELDVVDEQIAESALHHIHNDEIILTHTSSQTIQKFLITAAKKRKFTVVHAEAYPNDHETTHATIVNGGLSADEDERWKPLTAMGVKVILLPDSAVFALMSRINKVIMAPHTVLANGSLIAAAGASVIAQAAKFHHVPVVVLSGVYKLSPVYPFSNDDLIEYGDPGKVVPYQDGDFLDKVDVINPVYDHVDAELVDLYITNLGGHAPSYLYRIVADHYRTEDIDLAPET